MLLRRTELRGRAFDWDAGHIENWPRLLRRVEPACLRGSALQLLPSGGVGVVASVGDLFSEASLQILGGLHSGEVVEYLDGRSERGDERTATIASLRVVGQLPDGLGPQGALETIRRHPPNVPARQITIAGGENHASEPTRHFVHLTLSL